MLKDDKKKFLLKILAKHIKTLRGKQSQFLLASENDISTSIISTLERGLKDPQITTLFKLSEALNIKTSELIKLIEKDLPERFSFID